MNRKILSLLLALMLILGVMPISALAAVPDTGTEIILTDTSADGLALADGGDASCTCTSFCDDAECVVCEDDPEQCFYYYCICEAVCAEGEANPDCPICKDDYSKCAQAVEAPEIAPMVSTVEVISLDGYVTYGDGKITISGLPDDDTYIYMIYPVEWTGWQNTSQVQSANMDFWIIWTESVDVTTSYDGTALENGTTYYVYIAKTELSGSSYFMRSLGEAVVTPSDVPTYTVTFDSQGGTAVSGNHRHRLRRDCYPAKRAD